MRFHKSTADLFIPDGLDPAAALNRTTHLCIGAHQDDIEIMAYHGIAECFGRSDRWMTGVVVTNGGGSSRTGIYADFTDADMQRVRCQEQRKAAVMGEYAAQIQLDYSSAEVKDPKLPHIVSDLEAVLRACAPKVVYLHNPADKHDTHIGVLWRSLAALRRLPVELLPEKVYGCEVWRSLDWLGDKEKVILPANQYPNVAAALVGIFDSQISGGKRYDLATAGRRLANATYFDSHASDAVDAATYVIDLTEVVRNPAGSVEDLVLGCIDRFREDVRSKLEKYK